MTIELPCETAVSRQGNCYDNAPMESFWGSLKNELVYHPRYASRAETEASIREHIEIFITASGTTRALAI
jgi:putative transposase